MLDKLAQIETRYEELTQELSSPELLSNPPAYAKAAKQHRSLGEIVEKYRNLKDIEAQLSGAFDLQQNGEDEEMRELARVVRRGGTVAMLEFGVPSGMWRPLWELYVRVGLPGAGALVSPAWREVGRFLGPSIRGFYERYPLASIVALWHEAGLRDVHVRRLSVGGGVVVWGRRA